MQTRLLVSIHKYSKTSKIELDEHTIATKPTSQQDSYYTQVPHTLKMTFLVAYTL